MKIIGNILFGIISLFDDIRLWFGIPADNSEEIAIIAANVKDQEEYAKKFYYSVNFLKFKFFGVI